MIDDDPSRLDACILERVESESELLDALRTYGLEDRDSMSVSGIATSGRPGRKINIVKVYGKYKEAALTYLSGLG